jgi:hypothetical protein
MNTKLMIGSIMMTTVLLVVSFTTVVGHQSTRFTDKTPYSDSSSDKWYNLSGFTNYAPNGLPDFNQTQEESWEGWNGKPNLCGAVSLADILWWFDSKNEKNKNDHPGDGNDTYPLVQDYHATGTPIPGPHSDDHNYNNVNDNQTPFLRFRRNGELIERIAWYTNRQKDMIRYSLLGPLGGLFNAFKLLYGTKKWLLDCHLQKNYSVRAVFKPSFPSIIAALQKESGVILGIIGAGKNPYYESKPFRWGHFVAVAGINPQGYIALSDPYRDIMNPSSNPYEHNNASIVSHDRWQVNFTSPYPRVASWWLQDYYDGALINCAIIISQLS